MRVKGKDEGREGITRMVLNDFSEDIGRLCEGQGIMKSDLARRMNVGRQLLYRYVKHNGFSEKFTAVVEELGYDIEVRYVKR